MYICHIESKTSPGNETGVRTGRGQYPTLLPIVHPVEHDLWSPPVAGGHVAGHLIVSGPGQAEVQDLRVMERDGE